MDTNLSFEEKKQSGLFEQARMPAVILIIGLYATLVMGMLTEGLLFIVIGLGMFMMNQSLRQALFGTINIILDIIQEIRKGKKEEDEEE